MMSPEKSHTPSLLVRKGFQIQRDMENSQLISPPLTPTVPCSHNSIVSDYSPLCNLCNQAITPLLELYSERVDLCDKLEGVSSKLHQKELELQRYVAKVKRAKTYTEDIEDKYDAMADENEQLKASISKMTEHLSEVEKTCEELKKQSDKKDAELEELSRALFEEANGMVAKEAKLRHASESAEKQLQKQLAESQASLAMQQAHTEDMKARMSMNVTPDIDPNLLLPLLDFVTSSPTIPLSKLLDLDFVQPTYQHEFGPCLTFPKAALDPLPLLHAIFNYEFAMEPCPLGDECGLCEKAANYKMTDGPKEWKKTICQFCRDRIVSVCDYIAFLRNVRSGLYSGQNILVMWLESLRLRHRILYARLGSIDVLNTGEKK